MPEVKNEVKPAAAPAADKRPVSAVLYPDKQFLAAAVAAGELKDLLGVRPGAGRASACGGGVLVRRPPPGNVNAAELFFDWELSKSSRFGARLGRLKPQDQVKKVVAANHPCRARILADVAAYREAVSK